MQTWNRYNRLIEPKKPVDREKRGECCGQKSCECLHWKEEQKRIQRSEQISSGVSKVRVR